MKYPIAQAGEWMEWNRDNNYIACCDCGLVHKMSFKIVKGKIMMQMFRDERATAAMRRHKQNIIVKK